MEERDLLRSECVRTDRWKFIRYAGHPEYVELFDVRDDPDEERNLAADPRYARELSELRARCDERVRTLIADQAKFK